MIAVSSETLSFLPLPHTYPRIHILPQHSHSYPTFILVHLAHIYHKQFSFPSMSRHNNQYPPQGGPPSPNHQQPYYAGPPQRSQTNHSMNGGGGGGYHPQQQQYPPQQYPPQQSIGCGGPGGYTSDHQVYPIDEGDGVGLMGNQGMMAGRRPGPPPLAPMQSATTGYPHNGPGSQHQYPWAGGPKMDRSATMNRRVSTTY